MKLKPMLAIGLVSVAAAAAPSALADGLTIAVHPSKRLDPAGQKVSVIGSGYPANTPVQVAQCTGTPLNCQALKDVITNPAGRFAARVVVAFNFSFFDPYSSLTCSQPTFGGFDCLVDATEVVSPGLGAYAPIRFARKRDYGKPLSDVHADEDRPMARPQVLDSSAAIWTDES
jgi:hypothetical protein